MNGLDAKDQGILAKIVTLRALIPGPRMGDYITFPSGQLERFSHDWGDELQTSPSGSFFLYGDGNASFSGGLNPSTPRDRMSLIDVSLPGDFWFFHHGIAGAGRGVHFEIPCRVFMTTADYDGFLGKDFQSDRIQSMKKKLMENAEYRQIASQWPVPIEEFSF